MRARGNIRSLRVAAAAALVVALTTASPALGDTLLHADPTAENLTGFGGVLMWSRTDAAGRHHLAQRVGAIVSDAPVGPSRHPFEPDLGPGRRGRVVAVYQRCRAGFRRCDVYRLDVGSGRERRVRSVSTRAGSEFAPSVWGDRYAFVREAPQREGVFTAVRGHARFLTGHPALETDVRGRTVAFATYSPSEQVQLDLTGIYVHRVRPRGRGRSCLVDRGDQTGEEGTALNSPVLDGRHVYWHDFTAAPGIVERVARAPLSSACSRRPRVQVSDRTLPIGVDSIAVDRGTVYYTQGDYVDALGVYVADSPPPRFAGG
jgi:hypothetical protein